MSKLPTIFLLFLGGNLIFVFGSPYYDVFPTNGNPTYLAVLTAALLFIALLFKRSRSLEAYWKSTYALFMASAAILLLNSGIFNLSREGLAPVPDLAVDKFSQLLHIAPILIVLTFLARDSFRDIFLEWGDWKPALFFGFGSFILFGAIAIFTSMNPSGFINELPTAAPWILTWIFSNAFMEELWFRGIFLRKYERLVGRPVAIAVTSLVFGLSHINATYYFPGGGFVFGAVVFILGWIGAWAMYKYKGMLGAVLFHAAYDLIVVVPVLESA